jgi:hypothetical protein
MGDELANPFRLDDQSLVEAAVGSPDQDLAARVNGLSAALQALSLMQQSAGLGFASQIRELNDRVAGLERLVLRFVDADVADKGKAQ